MFYNTLALHFLRNQDRSFVCLHFMDYLLADDECFITFSHTAQQGRKQKKGAPGKMLFSLAFIKIISLRKWGRVNSFCSAGLVWGLFRTGITVSFFQRKSWTTAQAPVPWFAECNTSLQSFHFLPVCAAVMCFEDWWNANALVQSWR